MEIKLEKVNDIQKLLYFKNKCIELFNLQEDGYYVYYVNSPQESWSSHSLRAIADKLDEINKPFEEELKKYFEQQQRLNLDDLSVDF